MSRARDNRAGRVRRLRERVQEDMDFACDVLTLLRDYDRVTAVRDAEVSEDAERRVPPTESDESMWFPAENTWEE